MRDRAVLPWRCGAADFSAEPDYDNTASTAVMRKLGMRIDDNPLREPPWLQVVGILERPVGHPHLLGDKRAAGTDPG